MSDINSILNIAALSVNEILKGADEKARQQQFFLGVIR